MSLGSFLWCSWHHSMVGACFLGDWLPCVEALKQELLAKPDIHKHQCKVHAHQHHSWNRRWDVEEVELNSLAPGKFEWNFRYVIFKWILMTDGWGISCEIALVSLSLNFTDDQATLVQVMAWCCQATIQNVSQCWPRSLLPYDVTRPQWVNVTIGVNSDNCHHFFLMM